MGNCGSNPKTNEGKAPVPEPVAAEEIKVDQQEKNVEANTENTPVVASQENYSLANLLNEKEEKKEEQAEVKEEIKSEEVKAEAQTEGEAKPETTIEDKPQA